MVLTFAALCDEARKENGRDAGEKPKLLTYLAWITRGYSEQREGQDVCVKNAMEHDSSLL